MPTFGNEEEEAQWECRGHGRTGNSTTSSNAPGGHSRRGWTRIGFFAEYLSPAKFNGDAMNFQNPKFQIHTKNLIRVHPRPSVVKKS